MAETDWVRIAIEGAGWAVSSFVGLLIGAWRGGRRSVLHDQKIKDDYDGKIAAHHEQTRQSMAQYEKRADARTELLVGQFKESFEGIRRQIDQNKLDAEIRFLPKDDFKDWREEYREDMREVKASISNITVRADR